MCTYLGAVDQWKDPDFAFMVILVLMVIDKGRSSVGVPLETTWVLDVPVPLNTLLCYSDLS